MAGLKNDRASRSRGTQPSFRKCRILTCPFNEFPEKHRVSRPRGRQSPRVLANLAAALSDPSCFYGRSAARGRRSPIVLAVPGNDLAQDHVYLRKSVIRQLDFPEVGAVSKYDLASRPRGTQPSFRKCRILPFPFWPDRTVSGPERPKLPNPG